MKIWKSISAIVLLSSFLLIGCSSQQSKDSPKTTASSGEELYKQNCLGCHGTMGPGKEISTTAAIQKELRSGKNSKHAFAKELNDQQIEAIGDYVMTLKK
jgi:mono/diheme cytochrome c family protein